MGGIGGAILIDHEVGIAMVGCKKHRIAVSRAAVTTLSTHLSTVCTALMTASKNAGMAYHVGIGIIKTNEVGAFFLFPEQWHR